MNAPLSLSARAVMAEVVARAVRPRERLLVSQWADRHRILSSKQSGESGKWRTSRNPMLREIMDSLSVHSPVREVVVMKSSQVGVTELSVNWLGYIIEHAPGPAMVMMPTIEARDTWKAQKLNPLLTDTPVIRDILGGIRSRDAANSKDMIDIPGGIVFLAGGNSPNSYAQKSVRFLMQDDLDRFPSRVGDEGDPVGLARGRVKAFPRHKILFASTPTIKGASLIEREYEASDQRHYHVPCPHCGELLVLNWKHIQSNAALTEAWYVCTECSATIHEHDKPKMLAAGVWVAEHPEIERRGYHISALYAPIGLGPSWLDLVREFRSVCKDPTTLKPFINGNLGECWEDQSDKLKPHELAKRAEPYELGTIPPGCLALTVGIDTQDSWLAVQVLGWGADGKHWVVNWFELQGNTADMEIWNQLEAFLNTALVNSYGMPMKYRAAGIDSRGHRTEQVKNFVMRTSLAIPVYSLQGSTSRMGRAIAQTGSYPTKTYRGQVVKRGYCVWNVGTEHCKDFIYAHLAADSERSEAERVFHFPQGLSDEYFNGLLSETYDPEKKRYIQRLGAKFKRNEPLDTQVYAWAVGQHREVNIGRGRTGRPDPAYWQRLEKLLEPADGVAVVKESLTTAPMQTPAPTQPPARNRPRVIVKPRFE